MALKTIIIILFVAWLTYILLSLFETDPLDKDALRGKNVIVTGASSGIGEQMAYWYARYGANVFITARRETLLQQVISNCREIGHPSANMGYVAADMSLDSDRERVIQEARSVLGDDIDQLILNHAQMPQVYVWTGSEEHLDNLRWMLNVNVESFVHLVALSLPSLRRTGGAIGVVGSIQGRLPTPFTLEYAASKFALDGFFSGLRHEFSVTKKNVSITFCVIGVVDTGSGMRVFKEYLSMLGSPSELAMKLFSSSKAEDAANAIISATTRRHGELYFPQFQLIRLQAIVRSIFPQLFESIDLGLTPKELM